MASRGLRGTEDGVEKIANPEERAQTQRIGRFVIASTLSTAAVATLFVVLLP